MWKTTFISGRRWLYLLLLCMLCTSFLPPGSKKAAYRYHYRGGLQYSEGHYQRAVGLFRKAHNLAPDNYYFSLSLAVGLSRTGQADEGLAIMQRIERLIEREDPEFGRKRFLRFFFEGMIYLYDGQYGQAIPRLKRGINLAEEEDAAHDLSIMYNVLGYAVMMDQGRGSHRRADLPPHYHVHRRDMVRAKGHFEHSLHLNEDNAAARYNYRLLSDSLGLTTERMEAYIDSVEKKQLLEPTFQDLPRNIFQTLDFNAYEEVVFLLDISGSMVAERVVCMGETRFEVMRETAIYVLDQLPDSTRLGVGTIGGDCGTEPKLWHSTGTLARKALRQKLIFLAPDGTTPLMTILQAAPELFADSTGRERAIFLVSDGANECRESGLDICAWAEQMGRQGLTINIMTFLDATFNHANAFAEYTCLADNTDGKIVYLDNYRCRMENYDFSLLETCYFELPPLQKVDCWGPNVDNLWAIFPE